MSKKCSQCGAENREDAKHCLNCGRTFSGASAPVRMCTAGLHPMDPGWKQCPYCKANVGPIADKPPSPAGERKVERRKAEVENLQQGGQRKKTEFDPNAAKAPYETSSEQIDARIIGLLVTYSWRSEGQVFAIREGRTLVGRSSECEICAPDDDKMSGRHAAIIYRGNGAPFIIASEDPASITLLDGEEIKDNKSRLKNYSTISTGSTLWTFIMVEPESDQLTALF